MSHYSTIIKNGLIFDGKGDKPLRADIALIDDEIKKIGDLQTETAYNTIDATNKCVAPGFIDITSHSDTHWTIFSFPRQESLVSQGITTIIGGNCGSSLAPFLGEASAKEIGRWADVSKININWQTMGEFLAEMDKHKIGLNFGTLAGLNTLRRSIVSDKQKIAKIKMLLRSSLDQGAFGLSTNFGLNDLGFFTDEEIADIFKVLHARDAVAKHHLEDEGQNILPAISRLIGAARISKTRMHISHFKSLGRSSWDYFSNALEMIDTARRGGLEITYDFFPYTKTGSNLFAMLPPWFRKYSPEEAMLVLSSAGDKRRQDLKDHLKKITLHYDKITIASTASDFGIAGKTIRKIADESGRDGEEVILNLLEANDLRVSIFNEAISELNLELIAKDRFSVVSSDGVGYDFSMRKPNDLPHPRSFGTYPRAISQLVRKNGIIPLETMIFKMTALPARVLGIKDRGVIEKGKKADLVVFEKETIESNATYENPVAPPYGIQHVFINGVAVISSGKITGLLPGKTLRNQ